VVEMQRAADAERSCTGDVCEPQGNVAESLQHIRTFTRLQKAKNKLFSPS
jgi:hypothetical protein